MNKYRARLTDPMTYLLLGSFGALFSAPNLAVFGVPEVATQIASTVGLLWGAFAPTTTEKKMESDKREG